MINSAECYRCRDPHAAYQLELDYVSLQNYILKRFQHCVKEFVIAFVPLLELKYSSTPALLSERTPIHGNKVQWIMLANYHKDFIKATT